VNKFIPPDEPLGPNLNLKLISPSPFRISAIYIITVSRLVSGFGLIEN